MQSANALAFGRLWYLEVSDAIDYAKFRSRSHHAVIRVYDFLMATYFYTRRNHWRAAWRASLRD
jgi:hypothetical protein